MLGPSKGTLAWYNVISQSPNPMLWNVQQRKQAASCGLNITSTKQMAQSYPDQSTYATGF